MIKPLLLEVGVEELPAIPFLKELPNIEKKWADILEANALLCAFEFYYTPRRLVLWHPEFALAQEDRVQEVFGAPLHVAYKDGKPTQAALSFAKKCGVGVDALGIAQKDGKEVLYFEQTIKGQNSKNLIAVMLQEFLASLNFGKSMRWADHKESFIRPIRWIGAMLGDEHIPFSLYGVESMYFSYPHRSISYEPFAYDFAGDFFEKLERGGVILYPQEREKKIRAQFSHLEHEHGVQIQVDVDLLAEVVAITEYPKALIGTFDAAFLRLPPEVIITSMKEHQRYFPVFKDGKLSNHFIVVSNAICDDYELIVKGNEKVLRARLSDGLFFYDNDLKNGLSIHGLKDIVYLDGLGSVFDKVIREKNIVDFLALKYKKDLDIDTPCESEKELFAHLNRAIMLSKADLLSEMVYEFTELQGLMGYYYAKAQGENTLVSLAIKEQYLPNAEESELPSNIFSSIVALACKLDSLMALFSIQKIPTGTKDPYALRRAVNGIIKIVLSKKLSFDITSDLQALRKNYAKFDLVVLEQFFIERMYQFFDVNVSLIKAVLESGERDILKIAQKVEALDKIAHSSDFKEMFSTFKRVANIIKGMDLEGELAIDETLFASAYEKELYAAFYEKQQAYYESYEAKLDALFSLKQEIDLFFDNVMVNAEDEKLKTNRQNLIASIYKEFKSVADIKEITL
ncbi:MAG: glycine--tRNA ligase subunit beta [Sulfurospirillum sp.]|nr:glycine--tRNA ligase subunit beta [Sulfurospirillum sp.]